MTNPIAGQTQIEIPYGLTAPGHVSTQTKPNIDRITIDDSVHFSNADQDALAALEHQISGLGVMPHGRVLDAAAIAAYRAQVED